MRQFWSLLCAIIISADGENSRGSLGTFASGWEYNSAGLLAAMTYPADNQGNAGERVSYSYHPQMALDGMLGEFPDIYVNGTQYDAAGRLVERALGNEKVIQRYNYYDWSAQGGRLQRIFSGTPADPESLQDLRYAYDDAGNVLSIQDYLMGSPQTQTFTYDDLYRLTGAQASGGSLGDYGPESYTYDETSGNLSGKGGVSYTYGDPAHAHAVTSLSNDWTYQYDANGNMTQRNVGEGTYNLAYDAENHLVEVTGVVTATYLYNGDGTRVAATVGVTTTVYVGNYFEWDVSAGEMIKYYYAGAQRIAMREGSGDPKWLLGDHLGSTSLVYDGSQTIRQGYKAWGEQRFISGAGELPTTYRFTGQREEPSIGLYFYNARWYDPYLNRWIQPDIIIPDPGNPLDWDRYSYVRNNPVRYTDSSGHCIDGVTTLSCVGVFLALAATTAVTVYLVTDGPEAFAEDATEFMEWASDQVDQAAENLRNFAKNADPKPLTPDEQEKVDHLLNDLDPFKKKHPDLAEEAKRKAEGEELEHDHPGEAEDFMRGVRNDIEHLRSVRRSRTAEAQEEIDRAIEKALEWLEEMEKLLDVE